MKNHVEENKTRWKQGRSKEFWDHQEIEEREQKGGHFPEGQKRPHDRYIKHQNDDDA